MTRTGYVFGPVPSRRLGRSLGVDLVPFKTCTCDCIYCQLGRTTNRTVERREYAPTRDILDEVARKLGEGVRPDYVTLSGSGEPTLHSRLGEILRGIKDMTGVPVAVLTNGSLLWRENVVGELAAADLVIPSLDAGDERLFRHVNRPHEAISFERMLEGLTALREGFGGRIWLEVMLLAGVTGIEAEVRKIAALARQVRADRIQLTTAVRPTAEDFAFPLVPAEMERLARLMGPDVEVIADFTEAHDDARYKGQREDILRLLQRRPCTLKEISVALGLHVNEATKHVAELEREGRAVLEARRGTPYYRAAAGEAERERYPFSPCDRSASGLSGGGPSGRLSRGVREGDPPGEPVAANDGSAGASPSPLDGYRESGLRGPADRDAAHGGCVRARRTPAGSEGGP